LDLPKPCPLVLLIQVDFRIFDPIYATKAYRGSEGPGPLIPHGTI
jgi:hypothetical protein